MTKEEYLDKIREILNKASGDKELSEEDYLELCEDVSSEASDRVDAAVDDIEQEDGEDNIVIKHRDDDAG